MTTPTPSPDVRELAARAIAAVHEKYVRQVMDIEPEWLRESYLRDADAVLAAVSPVIRRQEREKIGDEIGAYADILARRPDLSVVQADVAWKLRSILGDPNVGVPDAPVTNSAPVRLRDTPVQRAKRRLFSRIIASAHLLDVPFTNAPEQSPWTLLKRDMNALTAAIARTHEEGK